MSGGEDEAPGAMYAAARAALSETAGPAGQGLYARGGQGMATRRRHDVLAALGEGEESDGVARDDSVDKEERS
jgi:hypothetical protein